MIKSQENQREIRIGFIGAGFVSLMHHSAVKQTKNARLVGVHDMNHELMKKRASEWEVRAYDSVEELVHSPEIDLVYILSPIEHHFEHAKKAIEAGKHLLVEKPVGKSADEIRELARLAKERGVCCVPGHNYIYNPSLWRIKRMIERNEMGDIAAGWIHYCVGHSDEIFARYPGVIMQIMSHHAYTLLYLLGRPKKLFAMATETRPRKLGKEDQAFVTAEMPNGALVNLYVGVRTDDLTAQPWPFMVKILGTEGGGFHSWREGVNTRKMGTHPEAWIPYEESYQFESDFLVNSVLLGGEQPLSRIEDAIDTQIILETAQKSIMTGKQIELDWGSLTIL